MSDRLPHPASPYALRFEQRPTGLYVHVSGDASDAATALQAWREIAEGCARSGLRRLFVETALERPLSVADMYDVCRKLPDLLGLRGVRIALLDMGPLTFELSLFGETVAVNRGILGRAFNDRQAAEEWLASDVV